MPNSKQIVYLSQSQYAELVANGEITVDGVTVTYDENDIYVTPQAEPVTDVRINGTSVKSSGVADIPKANNNTFGVAKGNPEQGVGIYNSGELYISGPSSTLLKAGINTMKPITVSTQHEAVFYGLSKVAGADLASETVTTGIYPDASKSAIQSMLGISDLIAPSENNLVASQAYAIGDIFTANGKLYKATTAIAANEAIILQNDGEEVAGANAVETKIGEGFVKFTDYAANNGAAGIVKIDTNQGIYINSVNNTLAINAASSAELKAGIAAQKPITPIRQHVGVFYGLAKAAGDTTQSASDNAVGTYTDDAKSAIRTMLGAVGTEDYATAETAGIVKVNANYGITQNGGVDGALQIKYATAAQCKNRTGSTAYQPLTVFTENAAAFYGLAYAAGDTTMASSTDGIGVYTDNAKASIKSMLGIQDGSTGTVDVTGTTPTITAVENTRYVCGEVTSLNFTPAASGICIVRFTSGSTVTVLTLPSTIKFPEWFDPTTLEANTIYEICVTDGIYGAVMSWAQ